MVSHVKGVRRLYRQIYKLTRTPGELNRMFAVGDASISQFARAFGAALNHQLSQEESEWVYRIETLRNELINSNIPLPPMDNAAEMTGNSRTASGTTVGQVCKQASKPPQWALLLFKIIREFKPTWCLELGTCLGISGSYQAAALRLNGCGNLVTLEGAESRARISQENFSRLGLDNTEVVTGYFQDTLNGVLDQHPPFSYVFIDGHHDGKATVQYYRQILPNLTASSVVIFDDIAWSQGMRKAWDTVIETPEVKVAIDMFHVGVCILDPAILMKKSFRIALN